MHPDQVKLPLERTRPDAIRQPNTKREYPERFCQGLAFAIVQNLARCERRHEFRTGAALPADLMHWLQGAVQASSVIHRDTWLPDFQT